MPITGSTGATVAAMNESIDETLEQSDSVHDYLHRNSGHLTEKVITLSANNTTASENIFQITGCVEIFRLYGEVTDATTLANCTAASFDLYDSTSAVQISAATGVLSGVAVGSCIFKSGLAANVFEVADATNGALVEQTYEGSTPFNGFMAVQKTGANTYIRFTYSTTDAPINAQITVRIEWRGLDGGELEAV